MNNVLLSLIIACKNPLSAELIRCITSVAALKYAIRIQLILVESENLTELSDSIFSNFIDFKRIHVPPRGVYAAYNIGINNADGKYLLFFGADDIVLPGMDIVLRYLDESSDYYHLYAGACYMEGLGLKQPMDSRVSLIFSNWCHQGIFYRKDYIRDHCYDLSYSIQADHKLNIEIVSNRSLYFGVSKIVVAYFSSGGISSTQPDLKFREDLPGIILKNYGLQWAIIVKCKQIITDLVFGGPKKRFKKRL